MPDNNSIANHIAKVPPSAQKIYKTLRSVARKTMPKANEVLYHNVLGYSLTGSSWDRICYIAYQPKGYVNFGFFFGVDLPDPCFLIEGEGKRMRHVKIYTMEQAKNPELVKLIEAAWKKAGKDIADWQQSLNAYKTYAIPANK